MVLNNTNKNNSTLLKVFASVFTVSSYFTDNPRITRTLLIVSIISNFSETYCANDNAVILCNMRFMFIVICDKSKKIMQFF